MKKTYKQPKIVDLNFNISRPVSPLSPTPQPEEYQQTDSTKSPSINNLQG
jgi:hypothetical protein